LEGDMAETTRMSSRGQVVVPRSIREMLKLAEGDTFVVFAADDMLIMKKIGVPTAEEAFEKLHLWGAKHAKDKGLKQKDAVGRIHKGRGVVK
jgi:AbrB family looped-hinge helix DNA binding protein